MGFGFMVSDLTPKGLYPLVLFDFAILFVFFFSSFVRIFSFFQCGEIEIERVSQVYALRLDQRWMMFAPPPSTGTYHTIEMQVHPNEAIVVYSDQKVEYEGVMLKPGKGQEEKKGLFGMDLLSHRFSCFIRKARWNHW